MFGCRSPICRGDVRTVYACPICIFIKLNCDRAVGVTRLRSSFSTSSYIWRSLRAERCTLLLFSVWKQVLPSKIPLVSACMFPLKFTPSLRPLLRVSSHRYHLWYLQKHKVPPRRAERFCRNSAGRRLLFWSRKAAAHSVWGSPLSQQLSLVKWMSADGFLQQHFILLFCFLVFEKKNAKKKKLMKHALSKYQCVCCHLTSVAPPPDEPQYSLCVICPPDKILDVESERQRQRRRPCFSQPSVSPLEF